MADDEATFELWRRGERVESFTGPRATAKAQAEARLHGYKMSDLAFVREVRPEDEAGTASRGGSPFKKVLTVLFYVAIGIFAIWIEFF